MSRILLLDTNFSSEPIYNYLTQSGHEVFVVGGNPGDFLARTATNYINLDYSKTDQIRELIKELQIEQIMPGCNDMSYQVCAEINDDGKYKGIDNQLVTETILHKEKFRIFAETVGLPIPRLLDQNSVPENWPVIVKPVDAYSGRGMTVLREQDQGFWPEAIRKAREFSHSGTCIVEQYIEGQLYSHSAFIRKQEIFLDFVVEEHSTANPFTVDTSRIIFDFPEELLSKIRNSINLMARELKLVDGLIHTQFIRKNEDFWLIEITRRCPGDLYSMLIELSTGIPYAEIYSKQFLGEQQIQTLQQINKSYLVRHTVSLQEERVFRSLEFNLPVMIEKLVPLSISGDKVKSSPFGRIALIFIRSKSKSELMEIYQRTIRRELYTID